MIIKVFIRQSKYMWDIIQAAKGTQKSSQLKCYYFEIRTVRNRTVQSLPLVHALYIFYEKRKKI